MPAGWADGVREARRKSTTPRCAAQALAAGRHVRRRRARSTTLRKALADAKADAGRAAGGAGGAARRRATRSSPPVLQQLRRRPGAARPRRSAAWPRSTTRRRRPSILAVYADARRRPRSATRSTTLAAAAGLRQGAARRRRGEEGRRPPTCRPTSSGSSATSTTRSSTSGSPTSGASSATRRPTGTKLIAEWREASSTAPTARRADLAPRPGRLRQDVPAVPHALRRRRQGRPGHHRARTAPTSTTCWRTSSTRSAVIPKEYAATRARPDRRPRRHRHRQGARRRTPLTVVTAERDADDRRAATSTSAKPSDAVDDAGRPAQAAHRARGAGAGRVPASTRRRCRCWRPPDNAKDFFNGKDLTGWDGDPKLWTRRERRDRRQDAPGLKQNDVPASSQLIGRRLPADAQGEADAEQGEQRHPVPQRAAAGRRDARARRPTSAPAGGASSTRSTAAACCGRKAGEKHVKAGRVERLRDRGGGAARCGPGSTASSCVDLRRPEAGAAAASSRSRSTPAGRWRCGSRTSSWRC